MPFISRVFRRQDHEHKHALVDKATRLAEAGRKLVLFDTETGLFAPWYLAMRCTEECYRATRYARPLSLLLIHPQPGQELALVRAKVTDWLRHLQRQSDIPAYLGKGAFAVLMPETGPDGASKVAFRLGNDVDSLKIGVASYPDDGGDYELLLEAATQALGEPVVAAA